MHSNLCNMARSLKLGAHESKMLLSILLSCAVKLLQDCDRSRPISGYQTCLIIFVIRVILLLVCAELKHFAYGFSHESMHRNSGAKLKMLKDGRLPGRFRC